MKDEGIFKKVKIKWVISSGIHMIIVYVPRYRDSNSETIDGLLFDCAQSSL